MRKKVNAQSALMGMFRMPVVWGLKLFSFMAFVGILGTMMMKNRAVGNTLMVIFPIAGFFAYYLAKKYDEALDRLND